MDVNLRAKLFLVFRPTRSTRHTRFLSLIEGHFEGCEADPAVWQSTESSVPRHIEVVTPSADKFQQLSAVRAEMSVFRPEELFPNGPPATIGGMRRYPSSTSPRRKQAQACRPSGDTATYSP